VKAGLCGEPEDWPWSSAGRAGVPVDTGNENANDKAGTDTSLAPHSLAGEDASVPRADGDVAAKRQGYRPKR
jgi:hypothetical protein